MQLQAAFLPRAWSSWRRDTFPALWPPAERRTVGASRPLCPPARLCGMWGEQPERSLISCAADNWSSHLVKLWARCSGWSGRRQMGTHALNREVISFAFPACQKCFFFFSFLRTIFKRRCKNLTPFSILAAFSPRLTQTTWAERHLLKKQATRPSRCCNSADNAHGSQSLQGDAASAVASPSRASLFSWSCCGRSKPLFCWYF